MDSHACPSITTTLNCLYHPFAVTEYKWYVYVVLPNGDRYRGGAVGTKKQAEQVERKIQAEIAEDKWEIRRTEDIPLRDVQELMEHRSLETTLQYAHLSEDHVKQQVMKLPFANG